MATLVTQTAYVSELTEKMIAEGWKKIEPEKETTVFNEEKINTQIEKLEYAKQEAIGFAEWADDNGWWREVPDFDGTAEKLWSKTSSCWENITTEQLYELYLKSKTNA